ncbi:hypothetical protein AB4Z46_34715 [Variovorax sp. M-6]|uniref:hypothetical protein n=1 Tax=Variovorax sp. M-6 TaxID=3233041 RepID=UPI003F96B772
MTRPAALRRAGVLAYGPRSREYLRRVMRSFGYAPLVFASLDELTAMGPAASTLDMLLLGDVPDTDSLGRVVMASARAAVGPNARVLHAPLQPRGRARNRGATVDNIDTASPRYFGDLYGAILSFLNSHGFEGTQAPFSWGGHAFHPIEKTVSFAGEEVKLDPVAFDVALEFFFSIGRPVTRKWLKRMLPTSERGANWHRIDNIACTVDDLRVAIQLHEPNGWALDALGDVGYQLRRLPRPATEQHRARVPRSGSTRNRAPKEEVRLQLEL